MAKEKKIRFECSRCSKHTWAAERSVRNRERLCSVCIGIWERSQLRHGN